jgi:hypothetical protein
MEYLWQEQCAPIDQICQAGQCVTATGSRPITQANVARSETSRQPPHLHPTIHLWEILARRGASPAHAGLSSRCAVCDSSRLGYFVLQYLRAVPSS